MLSANSEATLHVESLINDLDVSGSLTRDQFEELIQPLIGRINAVLEKVSQQQRAGVLARKPAWLHQSLGPEWSCCPLVFCCRRSAQHLLQLWQGW